MTNSYLSGGSSLETRKFPCQSLRNTSDPSPSIHGPWPRVRKSMGSLQDFLEGETVGGRGFSWHRLDVASSHPWVHPM